MYFRIGKAHKHMDARRAKELENKNENGRLTTTDLTEWMAILNRKKQQAIPGTLSLAVKEHFRIEPCRKCCTGPRLYSKTWAISKCLRSGRVSQEPAVRPLRKLRCDRCRQYHFAHGAPKFCVSCQRARKPR